VPQVSPFVFSELELRKPGIIFFLGQVCMTLGTFTTGYISDKTLKVRSPVLMMSFLAGISIYFFSKMDNTFQSPLMYSCLYFGLFMFSIGGIISLMNVSYLQNGFESRNFGRVRLFGTAGFALPNGILMFIHITPSTALRLSAGFFLMSTLALLTLPSGRDIQFQAGEKITWRRMRKLSTSSLFSFFIIILFFFFFGFSAAEYIVSDYIKNFLFVLDPVAFSWLIGTLVEIVVFFVSPFILNRYGPVFLIGISLFAGILRMLILACSSNQLIILFSQSLHGIQFSGAYLGSLIYLKEKAHPQRLGSAQALFTSYSRGMGTGTGAYILGNIAGGGNFQTAFLIAAAVLSVSLILLLVFSRVEKKHRYFFDG